MNTQLAGIVMFDVPPNLISSAEKTTKCLDVADGMNGIIGTDMMISPSLYRFC